MFYCPGCAEKNRWPESLSRSEGLCEACGRRAVCYDTPSKYLPGPVTAQDPHVHGRRTIAGTDLTSGAATMTPCGKKRPRERTSADPARVTCPGCRAWAADEERELAQAAIAAAELAREYPDLSPYSPLDFEALAATHDAGARQWEGQP